MIDTKDEPPALPSGPRNTSGGLSTFIYKQRYFLTSEKAAQGSSQGSQKGAVALLGAGGSGSRRWGVVRIPD